MRKNTLITYHRLITRLITLKNYNEFVYFKERTSRNEKKYYTHKTMHAYTHIHVCVYVCIYDDMCVCMK